MVKKLGFTPCKRCGEIFKKAGLGRHMYFCKGPKADAKPRALDKADRGFQKCHKCHKFHHYKAIKNCIPQAVADFLYFFKTVHKEKMRADNEM